MSASQTASPSVVPPQPSRSLTSAGGTIPPWSTSQTLELPPIRALVLGVCTAISLLSMPLPVMVGDMCVELGLQKEPTSTQLTATLHSYWYKVRCVSEWFCVCFVVSWIRDLQLNGFVCVFMETRLASSVLEPQYLTRDGTKGNECI